MGLFFLGVAVGASALIGYWWLTRLDHRDMEERHQARMAAARRELDRPPASIRELTSPPYDWASEWRRYVRDLPEAEEVRA